MFLLFEKVFILTEVTSKLMMVSLLCTIFSISLTTLHLQCFQCMVQQMCLLLLSLAHLLFLMLEIAQLNQAKFRHYYNFNAAVILFPKCFSHCSTCKSKCIHQMKFMMCFFNCGLDRTIKEMVLSTTRIMWLNNGIVLHDIISVEP